MKKHNFNAGPSILPREVIEKTAQAILDYNGSGLSLMEISHRAKDFQPVVDEARALFKELLGIPDGYSVLFLGGGASLEFCMVPYNFLEHKAAYLNTGTWAKKAMKEAKGFGEVVEVASSAENNYTYIPKEYTVPADADYFHITTNNTIFGTELRKDPDVNVPLVGDMSSDIFSRPVDVSKYICIYGGAQKNLAPAGVTFVIVKDDALGKVSRQIPTMLNYKTHVDAGSMFNTPPVVPIYAALQTPFPGHSSRRRPLPYEYLFRHVARISRVRGRFPPVRHFARHGRHQGTSLSRRIPRFVLQCDAS